MWNELLYKKHGNTRSAKYLPTAQIVPCDIPADIVKQGNTFLLLGSKAHAPLPPPSNPPTTAWEFYMQAPKWQKQIWGNANITREVVSSIEEHLLNDNINCAGDGSVKRGRAAHAW